MNYDLLNAMAITFLALGALWIFSSSVVHAKDKKHKEHKDSDDTNS